MSMLRVIQQSVVLPAEAETLFEMYLDPVAHAAFTGWPVEIGPEPGTVFRAFGGQLSGMIVAVIRPRLVVQAWRSTKFRDEDADSILILQFTPADDGDSIGQIDLVHLDVPEHDYQGVTDGWPKFYWEPWRAYLERR